MKLVATMPVRNEAWVLGLSARVALMWCDELVLLNHRSTDATIDIISGIKVEHPGRVHLLSTPDNQWNEMQHREMMLDLARGKGATHIAIVDADEVLTGNLIQRNGFGQGVYFNRDGVKDGQIFQLPGYNLRGSLYRYHTNGTWGQRWFSTAFKDNERLYWSSFDRGGYEHHHREPMGMKLQEYRPVRQGDGGVMHLWGASERRLRAKHRAYKIAERIKYPDRNILEIDAMYSWWRTGCRMGEPFDWKFADVPVTWWAPYKDLMKYLDLDAVPWQEKYCEEMLDKHGRQYFQGLDLFDTF